MSRKIYTDFVECQYCHKQFSPIDEKGMGEHWHDCPKHPAKPIIDDLRRQLSEAQSNANLLEVEIGQLRRDLAQAQLKQMAIEDVELRRHLDYIKANLDYLANAKNDIFELFVAVREKFDGSEYQQGKKDGLRSALALLGEVGMTEFNRGGSRENPR